MSSEKNKSTIVLIKSADSRIQWEQVLNQAHGVILGCPRQGQESDLMTLMGPYNSGHSMTL